MLREAPGALATVCVTVTNEPLDSDVKVEVKTAGAVDVMRPSLSVVETNKVVDNVVLVPYS